MTGSGCKKHFKLTRNNVQAIKSKTSDLRDYICSTDMDIFALTETWLTEKNVAAKLEFIPTETHKFVQ